MDPAARTRAVMVIQGMTTLIPGREREGESSFNRWSRSVAEQWLNSSGETLDTVSREYSGVTQ